MNQAVKRVGLICGSIEQRSREHLHLKLLQRFGHLSKGQGGTYIFTAASAAGLAPSVLDASMDGRAGAYALVRAQNCNLHTLRGYQLPRINLSFNQACLTELGSEAREATWRHARDKVPQPPRYGGIDTLHMVVGWSTSGIRRKLHCAAYYPSGHGIARLLVHGIVIL